LSVAVPDCPELFWGSSFTITSAAPAMPGTRANTARTITATRTAFDMRPPWLKSCTQLARPDRGPGAAPGPPASGHRVSAYATPPDRTRRLAARSRIPEAVDAGRGAAENRRPRVPIETGQTALGRSPPGGIPAGQVDHRPVAAPQEPVGAEALHQVLDVRCEVVRAPA